jgi:hypothetical protein
MSTKDDGGPAFPIPPNETAQQDIGWEHTSSGMSLRDYFAAKAMENGMQDVFYDVSSNTLLNHARLCYQMADAMLKARGE